MNDLIYKILPRSEWLQAEAAGVFEGSAVDRDDGYIHFSTAAQVRETAAKHFAGQDDLMLLSIDVRRLAPEALRFEPSRGGKLFPHLYGPLDTLSVKHAEPLPLGPDGHRFPDDVPDP